MDFYAFLDESDDESNDKNITLPLFIKKKWYEFISLIKFKIKNC